MDRPMEVIIEDVRIFTGDEFIEQGFVRFSGGYIQEIGTGEYKGDGVSAYVISRPGDTLIPGLIDSHIHALAGNVQSIEQSLRFGVTTVCDMHNDPRDNEKLRKLSSDKNNRDKYADFKCAGLGAVIEGGWPIPVMKKEFDNVPNGQCIAEKLIATWPKLKVSGDAEPYVRQQIEQNGASYIKMFHELGDSIGMSLPSPPTDVQEAVVRAAHKYGVITVGHAFSYAGAMALLRAGADGLTHMFLDEPPYDDFLQIMKSLKAHCSPTLGLCASQTGEGEEIQRRFTEDSFAQRMLLNKLPRKPVGFAMSQRPRSSVQHAYRSVKKLYEAGIPILVGTDAAGKELGMPYGLGVHIELYLLVHEVGMAPIDVLKAATSIPANRFGFYDRGKIEVGRKADFVLMDGNVITSLTNVQSFCLPAKAVWREGVMASAFE